MLTVVGGGERFENENERIITMIHHYKARAKNLIPPTITVYRESEKSKQRH